MLPFDVIGSGSPTLVFLHFYGSSRREWTRVIASLEGSYRCVAADAPGFGDASGVEGYTVEEMTQQVLELVASLVPEPVVLVGHSMMGKVSMVAASREPKNLVGLVLVAPSPLEAEPTPEKDRLETVEAQKDEASARAFFLKGAKSPLSEEDIRQGTEDALRANPVAWRRWPQSGSREDWTQTVPHVDLPALLVVGEHDPAIPLAFQKEHTLPRLRKGRLEVIGGVGHLTPYEAPGKLAGMIRVFVAGLK